MGLEVLNKKIQIGRNEIDCPSEFLHISNLIIPFSLIFRKNSLPDIYSGEECITFEERDSKFQKILISEFLFE